MPEKDFYQVSLKLILKNSQGEILILKALEDGNTFSGFYDLPGGRIDDDEFEVEFMSILKRELTEEVGDLKVTIHDRPVALGRNVINRNKIHVLYVFFEGNYEGGEVIVSKEHMAYKWVKLEDIKLEDYFVSGILEGLRSYLGLKK